MGRKPGRLDGAVSQRHAVFVTIEGVGIWRVSDWLDWDAAIAQWTAMDDQRRAVLADRGALVHRTAGLQPTWLRIRHYEVRSEDDPGYRDRLELDLARGFEVLSREYATNDAAAKAVLGPLGYYGKKGGWIYSRTNRGAEFAVRQGWVATASLVGHPVRRLKGEKGYRCLVTNLLQVRVEVPACR